ncbi:MAG TPA: signal peptide peptidase SppA [Bacteroidia bacterium]|nr:signal peptide peptidase SppA [Bacteroidia bacterium]
MKQFFKFMFASMLGFFLCIVLFIFIAGAFTASLVSSATKGSETHVGPGTVLHLKFDETIEDRVSNNPLRNFDISKLSGSSQLGLHDIIRNIKKAESDPNINGLYLDLSGFSSGAAFARELRDALLAFRKTKKFILTYADAYSQGAYYAASVANEIWVHPEGMVEFKGFASQTPYLKGLLSKLEIEPQIIRHGKYKSAVEPFLLDKMSDESREQVAAYVESFWTVFVDDIGSARNIDPTILRNIADSMLVRTPDAALTYKLVDKVGYFDEFLSEVQERNGNKTDELPEFISMNKYDKVVEKNSNKTFTRDRIAVIYASGDIVGGEGKDDEIGGADMAKTIRKARLDDHIKAVVLRVNSPGGDALASDVVWREVSLCRKAKPFIVSMGNVAASGGYYISCAADTIVAEPNTITGSIGVFGLMFNLQKMFSNKLGITFDGYKTSPFADIGTMSRPMTEKERMIITGWVEKVYSTFVKRVADGRHLPEATVDSLAQGRVWSGTDAKNAGLVDVLGGLDTAIEIAAHKAGITNYRIKELPEQKDPFVSLLEDISGEAQTRWVQYTIGDKFEMVQSAEKLSRTQGVQARELFNLRID